MKQKKVMGVSAAAPRPTFLAAFMLASGLSLIFLMAIWVWAAMP